MKYEGFPEQGVILKLSHVIQHSPCICHAESGTNVKGSLNSYSFADGVR